METKENKIIEVPVGVKKKTGMKIQYCITAINT